MNILMDMLKDKEGVIRFLLKTIESNDKMAAGLRKLSDSPSTDDFKISKLLEVTANQSLQIKHLSMLLLIYAQSSSFDVDLAKMLNKMGRGEEALRQMFKNKMKG